MSQKRGDTQGFDGGKETERRKKLWEKNKIDSGWRKVTSIRVEYTYISRTWEFKDDVVYIEKHISPWGMVNAQKNLLGNRKILSTYNTLPLDVKENFKNIITEENFNKDEINLIVDDDGNKGFGDFSYIYCNMCASKSLPRFLTEYKAFLPLNGTIEDVLRNWDKIVSSNKNISKDYHIDICGCLLPNDPSVKAGPNSRRFISRPIEHPQRTHDSSSKKRNKGAGAAAAAPFFLPKKSKSQNTIVIKDGAVTVQKSNPVVVNETGKKSTTAFINVRNGKKLKMRSMDNFVEKDLGMHAESKDDVDEWSKCYAMDVVLTGCKKMVSQRSSLEFYDTVIKGVKGYHEIVLGGVEINGRKIAPPQRIELNKNNISTMQSAILEAYINCKGSPNEALRQNYGKYYSIMHDGIQKFSLELNGVFLRTVLVDENGVQIVNIPWGLKKIEGGSLNADKLVNHVINTMKDVKPVINSAFEKFIELQRKANISALDIKLPPEYFKCCTLEGDANFETNEIHLVFNDWPVGLMGDGCSVNNAASIKLTNRFGLMTPTARCGSHAADGNIKRMSKSATHSVEEVKVFVGYFRTILRHFQLSGKSTSILNDALEAMNMKSIHLMTWCPTRMSNLLTCAAQTVTNLVPICDVLATCDIKVEERNYFMSPKAMIILHLLADLEGEFVPKFLRKLDGDKSLIIEVYGTSVKFMEDLDDLKTPLTDRFLDGLEVSDVGNLVYGKITPNGTHHIILQNSARPRRNEANLLGDIRIQGAELREEIINNLRQNIKDQMQSDTVVEFSSCFDLTVPCSLDDRIKNLEQLHAIYFIEYIHNVDDDDSFSDEWDVTIKYPPKLECTKEQLVKEFRSLWPVFNRSWGNFKERPRLQRIFEFYTHIVDNYMINFPLVCELILILMAVSSNTGPLERSYSKLAKICYKDRNQLLATHLETLYLLAVHKIQGDNQEQVFSSASKILMNK